MPLLILAALVVVYLILGVLYESYIHPLTILSTLPSAGVGALAALMLFHYDFSLIALIGIILLIGIVKKNGIMLVDFAMTAERNEGLSSLDAIRRAASLRFRPILMTTMAAILGGVPLMLGHGTGSEIRQPLGYSMVGGLIVSQALTLFTTPVIYLYLDQLRDWLDSWRRAPKVEFESGAGGAPGPFRFGRRSRGVSIGCSPDNASGPSSIRRAVGSGRWAWAKRRVLTTARPQAGAMLTGPRPQDKLERGINPGARRVGRRE